MSEHGYGWWQAADGEWYPPERHPSYSASDPNSYGWWQASDGNRYPPERHPDYRTAPTMPSAAAAPPTMPPPAEPTRAFEPPVGQPMAPPPGGSSMGGLSPIMIGMLVALGLIVIGSVLPWATIDLGFITQSTGGLDGDGGITIALALIGAGLTWFSKGRNVGLVIGAVVVSAICLLIAIIDVADVSSAGADLGGDVGVSVGIGLWLVLIASLAAVGVGIKLVLDARKMATSQ